VHSDAKLIARVEAATKGWHGLAPKKMFGGMAWMLHGNMCVGIWHESLVVRCGPAVWAARVKNPHVREMDITGRSMKGWLLVDPPAIATPHRLKTWLETARAFVSALPHK
jgi:hypothetical protein